MKKVVMVTKNEYKIKSIKAVLEPKGIQVEIEDFYVPEIQADCCEDVAAFGAKFAANHCGKPVIKADSGMYIEVLNGLPGIYTSQFQKKLGVEKVLKLMEGETNRKAKIVYALAFCRPGEEPRVFVSGSEGRIANQARGEEGMLIDFLFIPKGSELTLGELRKTDPKKRTLAWGDAEEQFLEWFLANG